MLYVRKIVSLLLLLTIASVVRVHASELPYKLQYENSPDLPNGIAFFMTLLMLEHFDKEFGRADPTSIVEQELGLSNVDADAFVSQALTTLALINADTQTQTTAFACELGGPGVDKKAQFAALQQTYAIARAVNEHYYNETKAGLDVATAERLQQWMDERKLDIGHFEIDFEKSYTARGSDPAETLSGLCVVGG